MNNVAVVWVTDYSGQKWNSQVHSNASATEFIDALGSSIHVVLEESEKDAYDELFQRVKGNPAAVEDAHLVYFSGHGTEIGLKFSNMQRDNGVASYNEDIKLGIGTKLAVAVFDCCKTLESFSKWKTAFEGLHYILGFKNIVQISTIRGKRFAELLLNHLPFPDAWQRAVLETEGSGAGWCTLRAVAEDATTEDAVWSNQKPPLQGPPTPFAFIARTEDREQIRNEVPPQFGLNTDTVPLFRVRQPGDRFTHLVERFGMPRPRPGIHGGWNYTDMPGRFLEVARTGHSIVWHGSQRPIRKLFEQPTGRLPSPSEAIAAANKFLLDNDLNDPRIQVEFVAVTTETHESLDGKTRLTFPLARHVDYIFHLNELPVFGPGARIRVTFESEKVDEFFHFWRECEQEKIVPVITADEAEELLRKDPSFEGVPQSALQVHRRSLGYFALPPTEEQDRLIPVYKLEGTVDSNDFSQDFVRYVQAVPLDERKKLPSESLLQLLKPVL